MTLNQNLLNMRKTDFYYSFIYKNDRREEFTLSKCLLFLFMFCFPFSVGFAQQKIDIKGNVVDELNEPIIGANILIEGESIGTITDVNGEFTLSVPSTNSKLNISYLGYQTQVIPLNGRVSISVVMKEDLLKLDEVVVVGYGTVKKRDLTGAISSIKSDDIILAPTSNPMEALQGKIAGLDITRATGQAGEEVTMQLRGTRSFTAKGDPTFIIDGMPGDYATLNPNDIESIEVLKDASSTAIYGSAGANGVIIITTKKAKAGKTTVNFNMYGGFNGWAKVPEMRSGDSYINILRLASEEAGTYTTDEALFSSNEAYQAHLDGKYIDWADELMQTSYTQNYSVSISGGTEKTKAYFSLNFSDENGQYKGDDYKVYSSVMRIEHDIRDWAKVGMNFQGSYVHRNKAYAKLVNALVSTPIGSIYDENGKMNITPVIDDGSTINLLLNTQNGVYKDQQQNFKLYLTPYIELNPLKGLSITSRLNAALNYYKTNYFQGEGSYQYYFNSGADTIGTNEQVLAKITQNRNYNYKWENIITYNFTLWDDHDFTLTGVTSWNHNREDKSGVEQTNIQDNSYLWHNIDGGSNSKGTSGYNMSKGMGYIGRINYSYLGKYLFSASFRYDGDSRLAKDHRWNTFPAVSAAWRISDEKFMQKTKNWLDDLKLRVGYGVAGTAKIDPYSSSSSLESSYYTLGGENIPIYRYSKIVANPDLSWEKSYNTNLGLDAIFLRGRINLTLDLYNTNTKGVIWSRNLPVTNGGYSAKENFTTNLNICETNNKGIEVLLSTKNIVTKDFSWSTDFTYSYNKEKITSLTEGVANNIKNEDYALSVGHPVNSFYNYKLKGTWKLSEKEDAAVFGQEPGDLKVDIPGLKHIEAGKYVKIENDEEVIYTAENKYLISADDYQIIGYNTPDWTFGFKNDFVYKDFDLSIFAYIRWGQMIDYELLGFYTPSGERNFPEYFDYWTTAKGNENHYFPALNSNRDLKSYEGYNALNYVDGSFIKIKNITLGYTMPRTVAEKIGLDKLRVYATITNPFIWARSSQLKGYDPEMNGRLNYPLAKQLVFGVNLSF